MTSCVLNVKPKTMLQYKIVENRLLEMKMYRSHQEDNFTVILMTVLDLRFISRHFDRGAIHFLLF